MQKRTTLWARSLQELMAETGFTITSTTDSLIAFDATYDKSGERVGVVIFQPGELMASPESLQRRGTRLSIKVGDDPERAASVITAFVR